MTPDTLDRDEIEATPSLAPAQDLPPARSDDDILTELRERRTYGTKAWKDIREEGAKDVMCVAGNVGQAMDPDGMRQRKAAGRPWIAPDEIGQYLNQTGNDVRQNKRSIKATPIGNGANKQSAEFIQGRIRQLEYRSNAQREVYSPIFEDMLQRSYGFGRFVAKRVSDTSRNLELFIEALPNPDVVLPDPDGAMLSPDCSKIDWAFILDASRTRRKFKREFGDSATITDFTEDHMNLVGPSWLDGDHVTLAEYWIIEQVRRRVLFLKSNPSRGLFEKEIPVPVPASAIDYEHWVDVPYVCQYLTNGLELLAKKGQPKRTPWPGKSIPLFSCFGKTLYVRGAGGTERRMLSMVRLMRDPVMAYAYASTCEIEVLGSVPRTQWVGYEGQFRGHEEEWAEASHVPKPFTVVKPFTEATGNTLLPLPVKQNWDPPIQNIDAARESFRRMIKAAAGVSPLPTDAQRQNQKSGKALDRIEASGQKGSYHFVDHLDGMITRVGQMAAELIPHYDDTIGEVTVRKANDEPEQRRINDPDDPQSVMVSKDHLHDITISVGPYQADEREASSNFADSLIENQGLMQLVGPQKASELTAAAIRLKAVGPIGDEMAEIISPKPPEAGEPMTPEQQQRAAAEFQGVQQENQQLKQALESDQAKQQATMDKAKLDADSRERVALAEIASRETIALAQLEAKRADNETKLAVAELGAKVDRLALFLEERARLGVREDAAQDRLHESSEAQAAREASERQAADGRAHEAALAADAAAQAGVEA